MAQPRRLAMLAANVQVPSPLLEQLIVHRGASLRASLPSPDYAIAEITWLVGCYRIDQVTQSGTQSCDLYKGPLVDLFR